MLDSGLVVVGVGLGPHAEGVGLEAGHAEHCVVPRIKDIWCYCTVHPEKKHAVNSRYVGSITSQEIDSGQTEYIFVFFLAG
jgi:hypothetical protein